MGLALSDLLTPESIATIRARLVAGLVADGFPTASWAPSSAGGAENMRLDMAANGLGIYMAPRVANIVNGRLLPLAADDERGPWLSYLGLKFYGLTRRPATKTVQNIALYAIGTGGTYTFSPGELWVRSDSTGNRYVNITGGQFSPQNTGPPAPGFPGNPLMLEFEAENAGSSYGDPAGTIQTMVTARAGVRCINIAPSDFTAANVRGVSAGTVVAKRSGALAGPPSVRVQITTSGMVGTAQFIYSLDGGVTWSGAALVAVPSITVGVGALAVVLVFADSPVNPSFIAGDIFTMIRGDAILRRGNDAESDDLFRRRCANRWPSLSSVPVAATMELWAQEASQEVTRVSVDANPTTPGGALVTIASATGPASAAAQIAVEDYIGARLLGYQGVPAPNTVGFASPAETALVVSAAAAVIIGKGVVRVPKAQLAAAQIAANNAWNAYLSNIPVGGQSGAIVELARFAQILADAGAIDAPSGLTLNGTAGDLTIPVGQVSVPPDNATLTQTVTWVPA